MLFVSKMSRLAGRTLTIATNNWDHLAPLACRDVQVDGLEVRLERFAPLTTAKQDPHFDACEQSLGQYLLVAQTGDTRWVGMPTFFMRTFRHRSFYTQRDSGFRGLEDLAGRRVGANGWPDSGNTWARAALRASGVRIDTVDWLLGPVDDPTYDAVGNRPPVTLPANVTPIAPGHTLREMLLEGDLDAIMCPVPPRDLYDPLTPIVRLVTDYEDVERAYGRSVGFCPAHHILAIRREVFDQDPAITVALYRALVESRATWRRTRLALSDTLPWLDTDMESTAQFLGGDWQADGLEPNTTMLRTLANEQYVQGLSALNADPATAFAEFASVFAT